MNCASAGTVDSAAATGVETAGAEAAKAAEEDSLSTPLANA